MCGGPGVTSMITSLDEVPVALRISLLVACSIDLFGFLCGAYILHSEGRRQDTILFANLPVVFWS